MDKDMQIGWHLKKYCFNLDFFFFYAPSQIH